MDSKNPYAPPDVVVSAAEASVEFEPDERIVFQGMVSRETVVRELATRPSWMGLATLGLASLVCFAFSPASFLNPLVRVGTDRIDPLSEHIGLAGLGFLVIACSHVWHTFTSHGAAVRERALLQHMPDLYTAEVRGWFDEGCIHLTEPDGDSWLAWHSLVHAQIGDQLLLLHWGNGVGGTTVLTRAMFANPQQFARACQLLLKRVQDQTPVLDDQETYKQFESSTAGKFVPPEEDVMVEVPTRFSRRERVREVLGQMPVAVLRDATELHWFFGSVTILALIFMEHVRLSATCLAVIWMSMILMLILMSVFFALKMIFGHGERFLASCWTFTRTQLHISNAAGYFTLPLDQFSLTDVGTDELTFIGPREDSEFHLPRRFVQSQTQWAQIVRLLGG